MANKGVLFSKSCPFEKCEVGALITRIGNVESILPTDAFILCGGKIVIAEKLDLAVSHYLGDSGEIFAGVGDVGDQRRAEKVVDTTPLQPRGVFQNLRIVFSRKAFMQLGVSKLYIHYNRVAKLGNSAKIYLLGISRGFDSAVYLPAKTAQQLDTKICLKQRLATRQSYSSAAFSIDIPMSEKPFGKVIGIPFLARHRHKVARADIEATPEFLTLLVFTTAAAKSAIQTSTLFQIKLGQRAQPLGIMAPSTTERTALEENGSPYTAAVIQSKLLDIKDYSRHQTLYS